MNYIRRSAIVVFLVLGFQTLVAMKTTQTNPGFNSGIVYLAKTDPVYIDIKSRVWNDWTAAVRRSDPSGEENKRRKEEIAEWPAEKQERFESLAMKALRDYNKETDLDPGYFIMLFNEVLNLDQKKLEAETDFRVRAAANHKFIAEFWEDGLAVNSEANALIRAKELAESPRAKLHPEEDLGNVAVIKKTFAEARKAITSGKQKRFTKLMAFIYIQLPNKKIVFRDPFQPLYDF